MRNACLRQQVLVVLQEAAQSLLAAHFAIAATHPLFSPWKKQNICFTLMVSLSLVVLDERRYRSPQGRGWADAMRSRSAGTSPLGGKVLVRSELQLRAHLRGRCPENRIADQAVKAEVSPDP